VRRLLVSAVVAGLLAVALVVAAAGYEVWGLGSSLTRLVRGSRGIAALAEPPAHARPQPPTPPSHDAAPPETGDTHVSFTVTQEDLGRVLGRRDAWLAGAIGVTREASVRVAEGHIAVETDNRVRLLGVPVARYAGATDWSLSPVPGGLGVQLHEVRLGGMVLPGAPGLARRLGRREDGWIVVPTGARHRLERIEAADGKLSVEGIVRGRSRPAYRERVRLALSRPRM